MRKNKNMGHALHVVAVVFLLLVGLALLGIYYTQPFDKNFDFQKRIAFEDISVVKGQINPTYTYDSDGTSTMTPGPETLQSASAEIGTLRLSNTGFFSKVYALPYIVGCIELKDSVDPTKVTLRETQFAVTYQADGTVYYPGQKIELNTDEDKNLLLKAEYVTYSNPPLSEFTSGNIQSVSIYVSDQKENNPLYMNSGYDSYSYNSYGYYGYQSSGQCEALKQKDKPATEILIG